MASEYLGSDVPALLLLAVLRDQFARDPRTALAAEIRLQEQRFGLSPLDRRRLQWEVERVESRKAPSPERSLAHRRDPRAGLHLVE